MYLVGIDIGGTKCAVTLGKESEDDIEILSKNKFLTGKGVAPYDILEQFIKVLDEILKENHLTYASVRAIGISCGGPLNSKEGIILSPPNLPGWDRIEIVHFFEEKTGIPSFLQNDADACAVAEWKYGAGKGTRNMIFLTFGTGFGAGLILNGALYTGTCDMAGEIGHIRLEKDGPVGYGKAGSAEGFCSGGGLAQLGVMAAERELADGHEPLLLKRAGSIENIDAKLIGDLAEQEQDALCLDIYKTCGEALGRVLSILVDLLNPEKIVIGGIYMRSAGLLESYLQNVLERETLSFSRSACTVCAAGLGEKIGDYAALSIAAVNSRKKEM